MVPLVPLQFGVPGAVELLVVLVIAVVLFGIPLVALVGLLAYLRGIDRKVDRIESRLEATEASEREGAVEEAETDAAAVSVTGETGGSETDDGAGTDAESE